MCRKRYQLSNSKERNQKQTLPARNLFNNQKTNKMRALAIFTMIILAISRAENGFYWEAIGIMLVCLFFGAVIAANNKEQLINKKK